MKRIAMIAVLAAMAGSVNDQAVRGAEGYGKPSMTTTRKKPAKSANQPASANAPSGVMGPDGVPLSAQQAEMMYPRSPYYPAAMSPMGMPPGMHPGAMAGGPVGPGMAPNGAMGTMSGQGMPPGMMGQGGMGPMGPSGIGPLGPSMGMPGYGPAPPPGMMSPYQPAGYGGNPYQQVSAEGPSPRAVAEAQLYGGYPAADPPAADYGYGSGAAGCSDCGPIHGFMGYDATADWQDTCYPHNGWFNFEILSWRGRGQRVPPLLTSSPLGTAQVAAGVLGQPNTTILFGNEKVNDDDRVGGRVTAGFWFNDAEYTGIEFSYAGLEDSEDNFHINSSFAPADGGPILATPFFNASTGLEDAILLAFPNFVGSQGGIVAFQPIDLNGTFNFDSSSETHMAGVTARHVLWLQPEMGWRTFALAGYRYLSLEDDLRISSSIQPVGGFFPADARLDIFDQFTSDNQFHGGDLGLTTEIANGPWSLNILTKVALGNVHQEIGINGSTTATSGGVSSTTAGGIFAQPTNIGGIQRDRFAVLPEIGLTAGYQFSRDVKFTLGYNFLYLNRVLRAGEQIDPNVNPTQFDGGILVGPAVPALTVEETHFYLHGLTAGMEWKW